MISTFLTVLAAVGQPPLGYPIILLARNGGCEFQIQDMIMLRTEDVRSWLEHIPDKQLNIDLVVSQAAPKTCLKRARDVVRDAGFLNVVVRRGSEAEYPDLLRATMRE